MVRYRRHFVPGGVYFFTVALADRKSNALTAHVDALRCAFRIARAKRPFVIDAIVILPDHLHTVMTLPDDDCDFSSRWRHIKTLFTQRLLAERPHIASRDKTGRNLWQRRFWEHAIRDHTDFDRHVDYIHFNPVKHGHADKPSEWRYSSIHRYIKRGILTADWATAPGNAERDFGEHS